MAQDGYVSCPRCGAPLSFGILVNGTILFAGIDEANTVACERCWYQEPFTKPKKAEAPKSVPETLTEGAIAQT